MSPKKRIEGLHQQLGGRSCAGTPRAEGRASPCWSERISRVATSRESMALRASGSRYLPASVSVTGFVERSTSLVPSDFSSRWTCLVTAVCEMFNLAARLRESALLRNGREALELSWPKPLALQQVVMPGACCGSAPCDEDAIHDVRLPHPAWLHLGPHGPFVNHEQRLCKND